MSARQASEGQEALFLHGGPGLSSRIERLWFGQSLPVLWWDQPSAGREPAPFDALVEAATNELRKMARLSTVHLIAHSFGGQLARALACRHPELIHRITLLGCAPNPVAGLIRLCRRVSELSEAGSVAAAVSAAENDLNAESFAAMTMATALDPAYPAVYFGPESVAVRDRFIELTKREPILDAETFLGVMNQFLQQPSAEPLPAYAGKVDLLMGRYDPILAPDLDAAAWRRVFPALKMVTVNCGHCVHLETAPDVWLLR